MNNIIFPFNKILLISKSVSRADLLRSFGLDVIICPSNVDEKKVTLSSPSDLVLTLSGLKMDYYKNSCNFNAEIPAVSADTIVYYDSKIIGKANNENEAFEQISLLSGNTHSVYTGFSLYYKGKFYSDYDVSYVTFKRIGNKLIKEYIDSKEWMGAAGSYKYNGIFSKYISNVSGDYNTVIGLPILKIFEIIKLCV